MPQSLSEHKQNTAMVYNLAAPGYDKPALRFFPLVATRLAEITGVKPGQDILDVATGTGVAAMNAARLTGPSARITAVDIAADMLAQARRNIETNGFSNIKLEQQDAENLSFADNKFDVVMAASSIFFLPDMVAGLREWRRVVRPGGTVAFSGFGDTSFQPFSDLFEDRIRGYGPILPPHKRPFGWQRLKEPDYSRILEEAGFENIKVEAVQLGYYLQDVNEWWDVLWNSGFRGLLAQLSPDDLERFKQEHLAEVAPPGSAKKLWLDIEGVFARGVKPVS